MKVTIGNKDYELDFSRAERDGYLRDVKRERPLVFGDLKVGDVFFYALNKKLGNEISAGIFVKTKEYFACKIAGTGYYIIELGKIDVSFSFPPTTKVSLLKDGKYINTIVE